MELFTGERCALQTIPGAQVEITAMVKLAGGFLPDAHASSFIASCVIRAAVAAGATIVKIEIQVLAASAAVYLSWRTGRGTGPTAIRRSARASVLRECDRSTGQLQSSGPISVRACIQRSRRLKAW
jgi:hypothetical protein